MFIRHVLTKIELNHKPAIFLHGHNNKKLLVCVFVVWKLIIQFTQLNFIWLPNYIYVFQLRVLSRKHMNQILLQFIFNFCFHFYKTKNFPVVPTCSA